MQCFLSPAVRFVTVLAFNSLALLYEKTTVKTYVKKGRLADFVETIRLGIAGSSTLGSSSSNEGITSPPTISLSQDMRTTEINNDQLNKSTSVCKQVVIIITSTLLITSMLSFTWLEHLVSSFQKSRGNGTFRNSILQIQEALYYRYWSGLGCMLYKIE